MRCSSLPEEERPRERLFSAGPEALGLPELLAILLRTGTAKQDVLELSAFLVEEFGGLPGLMRAMPGEFLSISGCGRAKAALLSAAMELARRGGAVLGEQGSGWESRVARLAREVQYEEREFLWALFLDRGNRLLGEERLSYGGLDGASLDIPLFLRKAVRLGAEQVVLLHNHPGGSTEPSPEDRRLTSHVASKLRVLDMELKEHYILGGGSYDPIL